MLLDQVINQPGVDLYVNNTVTAASTAAVEAFECARVPVGRWDRSGVWYTHRQRYYESRLLQQNWPFAKPLSYALSAPVSLKDRLTTRERLRCSERCAVRGTMSARPCHCLNRLVVEQPRNGTRRSTFGWRSASS